MWYWYFNGERRGQNRSLIGAQTDMRALVRDWELHAGQSEPLKDIRLVWYESPTAAPAFLRVA